LPVLIASPTLADMPSTDGKIRILAIHGGGIRGAIPARILQFLEEATGQPIWQLFDMVCGTSTGGLLAAVLAKPTPLSAAQALQLYRDRGKDIFYRSVWQRTKTLNGKIGPRYDGTGLDNVLREVFQSDTIASVKVPLFMPAYDIENRTVVFFKSWEGSEALKIKLSDACRATSSGPTYFPPGEVYGRYFIDGGTVNNNPALSGVIEGCMKYGVHTKDVLVLSLGTGIDVKPIPYTSARGWGPLGWVTPLISVFTDGVSDLTDYQMRDLMRDSNFFHYQTILPPEHAEMDNVDDGNVDFLIQAALGIIDSNKTELLSLGERLKGVPGDAKS